MSKAHSEAIFGLQVRVQDLETTIGILKSQIMDLVSAKAEDVESTPASKRKAPRRRKAS